MAKVTRESEGLVIEVFAEEEYEGPEGCFDTGDKNTDKEICEDIRNRLASGNEYAWFCARVKITYRDLLTADTYLGCCSYESKEDFIKNSGYYNDMVSECIADINTQLDKLSQG